MALKTKIGQFTSPNGTDATYAVTGVGFTPKLVIFFPHVRTTNGADSATDTCWGMGATDGTNEWYCGYGTQDAAATTSVDYSLHNARCIIVNDGSATSLEEASFVSFDSDGFTLNYSKSSTAQRIVQYMALGGKDLEVLVNDRDLPSGTSSAFTLPISGGFGFEPKAYIGISPQETRNTVTTATGGDGMITISFSAEQVVSSTNHVTNIALFDENAVSRSDTGRHFEVDAGISNRRISFQNAGNSTSGSWRLTNFSSTTISCITDSTTAPAATTRLYYIAIGGANLEAYAGQFTVTTSASTQTVSTRSGFTAQTVLFAHTEDTTEPGANNNTFNIIGMSNSSEHHTTVIAQDDNNADAVPVTNVDSSNAYLGEITFSSGAAARSATVSSFADNQINLSYNSTPSVANIVGFLALEGTGKESLVPNVRRNRMRAHLAR